MKKPWETEDWRKAPGIVQNPAQTNSALAERDYTVECGAPSENLIQIVKGYWIWWCSAHHQPKCLCEIHKAQQETTKAKERLDKIVAFVDRNQWIGNDEKLIIMRMAEGEPAKSLSKGDKQ